MNEFYTLQLFSIRSLYVPECAGGVLVLINGSLTFNKAAFGCFLIHTGLPQQVAPRVCFGRVSMSDALPDAAPVEFVCPSWIKPGIFQLLINR